jgi:hypothetical protein
MSGDPLQIDLGKVEAPTGGLEFTLVVGEEGDAHVQVYATDPSAAGKGGVLVMLDGTGTSSSRR